MTGMILKIGAAVAVALIVYRIVWHHIVDRRFRFHVSGGRGGVITAELSGYKARAEYEVGSTTDFIIYESSLSKADGTSLSSAEKHSFIERLHEWSSARHSRIEIANDIGAEHPATPTAQEVRNGHKE